MRSIQRRSPVGPALLGMGLLVLGVVGTVGVLWGLGKIELPFLARHAEYTPPEGAVPVFLSLKPIPAYTRVSRDHLFTASGQPKLFYLPGAEVEKRGLLTDFNQILGRVVAHDHREGYGFREKDFLPEGTRDGIAGGTPPGKRSLTLDATKIAGINTLKTGDHFDLVATYLLDVPQDDPQHPRRPSEFSPGQKKYAITRVLAHKGLVVQALATRSAPKANTTVQPSGKMTQIAVQEVVVAVEPEEATAVSEAMVGGTEIRAIHRSGHPDEASHTSLIPGTKTTANPHIVIEIHRGKEREFVSFPAPRPPAPKAAPREFPPPYRVVLEGALR